MLGPRGWAGGSILQIAVRRSAVRGQVVGLWHLPGAAGWQFGVTVKIAGTEVGSYDIGPSQKVTPMFAGIMNGPVEVTSDINIFTSERGLYGPAQSFNETLGFPHN